MAEVKKRFGGVDVYNGKPIVLFPITETERAVARIVLETAYLPIKLTEEVVSRVKRGLNPKKRR